MPQHPASRQPGVSTLLIISACMPDPHGSAQRQHAWRLLEAARRQHQVYVLAIADGPVNLRDWQRLQQVTEHQALLPRSRDRALRRAAAPVLAAWQRAAAFDSVLCDVEALWPLAQSLQAPVCIDSTDHAAAHRAVMRPAAQPTPHRRAA